MLEERLALGEGIVLELFFASPSNYKMILRKRNHVMVEYSNKTDYDLKSVEKLRYDFERDVEKALRRG